MKEYGTKCGGSVSARQTFTSYDFECSNEPGNRSDKKRKCQIHHRFQAKLKDKILSPMMQGIGSPTSPILSARNKAVNWKVFKQQWENYSIVAQLERQREEYRVALFLYSIGPAAVKIYNTFDLSEANRHKLSEIIKEFDKFVIGETNEMYEHSVFNSRDQKEGESIDTYVGELRTLAQSCNFCTCLHDTLIRDRIVLGLRDRGTRKRLLRQGKLTVQKCIEIAKSDEVSNTQIKNMDQTTPEPQDVHKVKTTKPKKSERKNPKQTD